MERSASLSRSNCRRPDSPRYGSVPSSASSRPSCSRVNPTGCWISSRYSFRTRSTRSVVRGTAVGLQGGDEALDALVGGLERVLAEQRPLRLVVELQVDPVDRVVALL